MISRVYEGVEALSKFENLEVSVCVVTDDERIETHLIQEGHKVVRVDDDVPSGTERIKLAHDRYFSDKNLDYIINVQGDEPLVTDQDLFELISFHEESDFDICTIVLGQEDLSQMSDPNRVKVAFERKSGRCHYFSRAPIPYDRDGNVQKSWFLHVGVYCYRPYALKKFSEAPMTEIEKIEKLEQLRALSLGFSIGAVEGSHPYFGVDKPEDIEKVEGELE